MYYDLNILIKYNHKFGITKKLIIKRLFLIIAFIIPQKNNEIFEIYVASDCFLCYNLIV